VEPVQPPPAPFHVAVQQALCRTLQDGFVSQRELLGFVSQNALDHLFAKEFLVSDGPAVMIGPEAERSFGKRNYLELLSVFDTPPLFLVEFNGREVGWIHELSLERRRDGSDPVILLGGRAWWVRFVNWERKTVSVEPSDIEGRSLWLGSSAPLSFELCQAMRRVLDSEFVSKSWSHRAQRELASFRHKHLTDNSGTVLHAIKSGCVWWTFAGIRANALIADWLRSKSIDSRSDNLRLICDCSVPELSKAIRSEIGEIHLPEKFTLPKFAEALSKCELSVYAKQRLYDEPSAQKIIALPTVQAHP
jgi:ATP-dependent helicase Lhr and Lhr-like helicase